MAPQEGLLDLSMRGDSSTLVAIIASYKFPGNVTVRTREDWLGTAGEHELGIGVHPGGPTSREAYFRAHRG